MITSKLLHILRYDPKLERQTSRTVQNRVQQQYGKAKDQYQKAVTKGCPVGTWTQSIRSRKDRGLWGHIATTQTNTDPKNTAPRLNAKLFGAAIGSQTLTRRDAPQMSNRAQNTLQPLSRQWITLTAGKPYAKFGQTERDTGRKRRHKTHTFRGGLDKMAQFIFHRTTNEVHRTSHFSAILILGFYVKSCAVAETT